LTPSEDKKDKNPKYTNGNKKYRWLRRLLRIALGILIFLLLVVLFIRSPWGQDIIVNKVVNYVSKRTNTTIDIERLFITFDGDVQLDGLYLEDIKGDTLVYSKSVEANVPLWELINGEAIGVEGLDWEGLRANIIRKDTVSGFNFQFLIDAFATSNSAKAANDTTSKPMKIILGNLNFKNFDIVYDDKVTGINSHFKVGKLIADMEKTDIENMIFEASELEIANSEIEFIQTKSSTDTSSTSEVPLPKFSVESVRIDEVQAYYKSKPNELVTDLDIGKFEVEIPNIDLQNQDIIIGEVTLKNSEVAILTEIYGKATKKIDSTESYPTETKAFQWPPFKIDVARLNLENNNFDYRAGNAKPTQNEFNPDAITLTNIVLDADNIFLKNQTGGIELNQLNFKEFSSFDLDRMSFNLNISEAQLSLEKLNLKLNQNVLNGYAELNYKSLSKLIEQPEQTNVNVNFPKLNLSIKELFKLQPKLEENTYLKSLSEHLIRGNINASGTLANINVPNLVLRWGDSTKISTSGTVQNATNVNNLKFDVTSLTARTTREDAIKFVDTTGMGLTLPQTMELRGKATGSFDNLSAEVKLKSSQGNAQIEGDFNTNDQIAYNAKVTVAEYKVNELLNNPQFGELTVTIESKGEGSSINTMDANIDATIEKFQFNDYAIKNLSLNGKLTKGSGSVKSKYKDDNLNMTLDAFVVLDSIAPEATAEIDVIGADLQALGIMRRDVKTGMTIYADFKGNANTYDASAIVDDGVFVYDNRTYLLGSLDALAHVTPDTTSVSVRNKMLDLNLKSNANPQTLNKVLTKHVRSYFYRDSIRIDTITRPVNLKLKGKIAQSPLLNDVFLVNAKDIDTVTVNVDFSEKKRRLNANITAPHINYSGNEIDSLKLSIETDQEYFKFNLGFDNITAGPLNIPETVITGNQSDSELALNFHGTYQDSLLLNVDAKITGSRERLVMKVDPDSLILNTHKWDITDENEMILTDNKLEFNQFKIIKNNQSIEITDKLADIEKNHAALIFEKFKISEVFNYLNPEKQLAEGRLNGIFVLEDPFNETGIIADLDINELRVLKTDFGTLSLDAQSLGGNSYDFNAELAGGQIELELNGDYVARQNDAEIDLDLNITNFEMKALNNLSMGEVKNAEGNFTGQFKLTGSTKDPQYKGELNFTKAEFNIARLNAPFTLENETLLVDNDGLTMNEFTILDSKNNALVLSGDIGTESFINPTFDLNAKATDFHVLNSTKEDNELFYGQASFDADAKLTGDLQIPKVDAELTLRSDTDFTYVLPTSVASIEERDGVVVFVNRENPDAILTQTEDVTATVTGFDISSLIKIKETATATIIINEDTGDNFRISGEGELDLNMSPNGRITLSGVYEISDGHYELTLYNLVNRKFEIADGSRVSWSGDPFDAKLDVRAVYNVETSASSLMSPAAGGINAEQSQRFQQEFPFFVYLNIDGELMQPEISFKLDMPEDEQGAAGGQVYGRVQTINQQENQLNRQVFSLLVLNKFYPDSGSDGSAGGFATVARDNLNDAVSSQLNTFSDKILGDSGIELDFGLDSYTDYQGNSPQERTQLDVAARKKLFDDRLIVSVGSEVDVQGSAPNGQATPLIGNVSLEYILTEDGRYRLKGFRKNEFENVIDGQTIVSGIGIIFTQEFNTFRNLWDVMFRSQNKDEENAENEEANDNSNVEDTPEDKVGNRDD